ncbi:MAG TPA: apolipoprotein N-acyltransferase [Jiangellales bacterium]|nr:apolipoprotein N-acyltransferase [Jiangellales bacterium]
MLGHPLLRRAGLGVAAGVALLLAFPPYDVWPAAVAGVALLTVAVRGAGAAEAGAVGLMAGLALFVPLLSWTGIELGPAPWLILTVFQASYVAVLGACLAVVLRLPGWPWWTACLWVAQEAVRGRWPFEGFTWGRLAFSQADAPTLGLAQLGGAPLVTFAVALAGGWLAWAALRLRDRRPRRAVAGVAVAGVAAWVGLAVPAAAVPADTPRATVALVQGNVPRLGLDFNAQREEVLRNHVTATVELAARVERGEAPAPDLVLWPENSSDIDPYRDADAAALIDTAARAVGVPVLVGAVVATDDGLGVENTGIVWDPATGPGDTYVKQHPVPFAEYVPLRSLARVVVPEVDELRPRDMVSGNETGLLRVGPVLVGDVICFEVAYDGLVTDTVRGGAELIAVQTNNATFGFTPQTEQQLAMSRLRAAEHGRAVLVAATSGVSAVVDPDGSVRERAEVFTREVLVEQVPLLTRFTPATRLGALPETALSAVGILAVLAGLVLGPWPRRPADDVAETHPAGEQHSRSGPEGVRA